MPGPGCKPRVRSSIVSRPWMARELIRVCGRRSDLLRRNAAFGSGLLVGGAPRHAIRNGSFFANIAQTIRACLAAMATQAR